MSTDLTSEERTVGPGARVEEVPQRIVEERLAAASPQMPARTLMLLEEQLAGQGTESSC